jgi:hypothetical protein
MFSLVKRTLEQQEEKRWGGLHHTTAVRMPFAKPNGTCTARRCAFSPFLELNGTSEHNPDLLFSPYVTARQGKLGLVFPPAVPYDRAFYHVNNILCDIRPAGTAQAP